MARWSKRALRKYILLQIPGTALLMAVLIYLKERLGLSWGLTVLITSLWVAKDVALFPFVWKAYDHKHEEDPLLGQRAIAQEALRPSGYVRVRGELWHARLSDPADPVEAGGEVLVTGREGLVLSVRRAD